MILDTAAGIVHVRAHCDQGRCLSCTVSTPPAFPVQLGYPLEVGGYGTVDADIGWGDWFYGFVDAKRVGFDIVPDEAADIVHFQKRLGLALKEQTVIKHPYDESINKIDLGAFPFLNLDTGVDGKTGRKTYRYANMMPGGRIDRSPCGYSACSRKT